MKEYLEKVTEMSEDEKKERVLKGYTVLNNLPRSQAEEIIIGLAAGASLYNVNVEEIFEEELALAEPPQLGAADPVWA